VLKALQVETAQLDEELEEIRLGMEALGEEYLADLNGLVRRRLSLLERATMPKRACLQLAKQWVREVIEDTWTIPARRQQLPDNLLATPSRVCPYLLRAASLAGTQDPLLNLHPRCRVPPLPEQ
jgi:hypothetical protein